ncbi:Dedicator of cytokinesis protein 3 [Fragariocoptes setiger]|uniref:Dedicator of cytokinesis protein 3 n=1 Tax=Fragariocoptes setiger TaxID=1670756 RepID=A0ABQ7SBA5_9ACAR|nr:Dedicator of cytokinesis protein 3 [Fragariocoptes setiger]
MTDRGLILDTNELVAEFTLTTSLKQESKVTQKTPENNHSATRKIQSKKNMSSNVPVSSNDTNQLVDTGSMDNPGSDKDLNHWKDKYSRLLIGYQKLQAVNHNLEDKLLKLIDDHEREKGTLIADVNKLSSKLVDAQMKLADANELMADVKVRQMKESVVNSINPGNMYPDEDHTAVEVTGVLHEWHNIWIETYLNNNMELFDRISIALSDLIDMQKKLISSSLPSDQIRELKQNIASKIDWGNNLLGLGFVPRIDSEPVVPAKISPIKMYLIHAESSESSSKPSYSNSRSSSICSASVGNVAHQLSVSVKDFNLATLSSEKCIEIYLSVIDATSGHIQFMTEKFVMKIQKNSPVGPTSTIFSGFRNTDLGRDLYLFIQIYRVGSMVSNDNKPRKSIGSVSMSSVNSVNGQSSSLSITDSANGSIDDPNISNNICRRPYGAAIVALMDVMRAKNEMDFPVKLVASNESDFHQIHEILLRKQGHVKSNLGQTLMSLNLTMKYFKEIVSRSTTPNNELSWRFEDACIITPRRGLPDIIMPGDFRNELHMVLESGEFEKGGKSIAKNIEASISLIGRAGLPIENCISIGTGIDYVNQYKSCVFYHNNSPRWNETLKFNIPLDEFDGAHVRIEFRHCSTKDVEKKFLGFSFLPLTDDEGVILPNKQHELYLYKCDLKNSEDEFQKLSSYIELPSGPNATNLKRSSTKSDVINQTSSCFVRNTKESIFVTTMLLSTKLTQNSDLLALLKWRELSDIESALKKVLVMDGDEIVKFLQDILDSLFDMFSRFSTSTDDPKRNCSGLIFKVLVHISSLLEEPKYSHFKPVLDTYVSDYFSSTLVYRGLLACVKQCADFSGDTDKQVPIQMCFKSLYYVFQFIIQSRLLFIRATGDQNCSAFNHDLQLLFSSFTRMLADVDPNSLALRVTFLNTFPSTYDLLLKVMSAPELARVVVRFISHLTPAASNPLTKAKVKFMQNTINSEIFKNQDARLLLVDNFSRHIELHVSNRKELSLCTGVMADLLIAVHDMYWPNLFDQYRDDACLKSLNQHLLTIGNIKSLFNNLDLDCSTDSHKPLLIASNEISKEIRPFVVYMVKPIVGALEDLNRDTTPVNTGLVRSLFASLLTIFKLMSEQNFNLLLNLRLKEQDKDFLAKLYTIFKCYKNIFGNDWYFMLMVSNACIENCLREIGKSITGGTMRNDLDRYLSTFHLELALEYLTQPSLQLESFSTRKRACAMANFGDLRLRMGTQVLDMWNKLAAFNRSLLIPSAVAVFLESSFISGGKLQRETVPVFYDMMDIEWKAHGATNFGQLELCLIDNLDTMIAEQSKCDKDLIDTFEKTLVEYIASNVPSWKDKGISYIESVAKLMRLLVDYREVKFLEIEHPHNEKRMSCIVDLLHFYKQQMSRDDLYYKYLFKLCDIHVPAENFVEAAFTLKLYADSLGWSRNLLPPIEGRYKQQEERTRKEILYEQIIDYFDRGKCWEEAIPMCKQLITFYESTLIDYKKLAHYLRQFATFADNILAKLRPEREYFRVGFYGTDFPHTVRNKEFVYRGGEYERLPVFMQRILDEYPSAKIISSMHKQIQSNAIASLKGQHIVISNVKPVPDAQHQQFRNDDPNVSEKIVTYYLSNRVDTFTFDKPLQKGTTDKDNEFRTLWVERTIVKTNTTLPGILPWFPVVEKKVEEITPIAHAIETIHNMNIELNKLIGRYVKNSGEEVERQISPLTMRLQGVIEAAVSGGIAVILDAFLSPKFAQLSPEMAATGVPLLRQLINHQFRILENGLALHGQLAPAEVQPLHALLVERLQSLKKILLDLPSGPVLHSPLHVKADSMMNLSVSSASPSRTASIIHMPLPPMPPQLALSHASISPEEQDDLQSIDDDDSEQIYSLPSETPPVRSVTSSSFSSLSSGQSLASVVNLNGQSHVTNVNNIPSETIPNTGESITLIKRATAKPITGSSLSAIALSNLPSNRPKPTSKPVTPTKTALKTNGSTACDTILSTANSIEDSHLLSLCPPPAGEQSCGGPISSAEGGHDQVDSSIRGVNFSLWDHSTLSNQAQQQKKNMISTDGVAPPLPPRTLDRHTRLMDSTSLDKQQLLANSRVDSPTKTNDHIVAKQTVISQVLQSETPPLPQRNLKNFVVNHLPRAQSDPPKLFIDTPLIQVDVDTDDHGPLVPTVDTQSKTDGSEVSLLNFLDCNAET